MRRSRTKNCGAIETRRAHSVGEEVEHIAECRGVDAVNLRELTACAGHGREAFVLHVEDLGEHPAGGTKLIGVEFAIVTLRAFPVAVLHR